MPEPSALFEDIKQRTRDLKPVTSPRRGAAAAVGKWIGVVLLSLAVLAVSVLILVPRVTGSQTFSVLTSSMAPKLGPGTFLVMAPASFPDLRTGDVVTYQLASGRPDVVTHRIVGFSATQQGERTLITKGDNNSVVDPAPVREVQVRGRLFYAVPYAGYLANALGNSDRTLWMTVGAIGLIGYGLGNVIKAIRRGLTRRRRKQHPATGEQP
ncbi:signal peptidase I [Arthrobacter sp. ISL-30]|nr:signal peptidase I [Arthrobacter sp. ISL-30]